MLEKDFKEIIINIKKEIKQTQVSIMSDANARLINLYFNIGKIIYENSKWGNQFIERLEQGIKLDFPNIKGFSSRNLGRMKKFYIEYKDNLILPMPLAKLPWSHNTLLLDSIKDLEIRKWYAEKCFENSWSHANLKHHIDMLFYNLKLRCYVVIELKTKKFKPEYAGKLNFYLSAVDDILRNEYDNPTIGLILCQEKDKFTVEYALKDINKPIGVSSYEITKILPKEVLNSLPTEEDINMHINKDNEIMHQLGAQLPWRHNIEELV